MEIVTISKKGGQPQRKETGYTAIKLRHNLDEICVDDYEGVGSNYKKRETQLINIYHNGNILFSGDKYELFNLLKTNV